MFGEDLYLWGGGEGSQNSLQTTTKRFDLLSQQNKKIMTPIELHAKNIHGPHSPLLKIYMDPTPPPPTHTHCL